MRAVTFSLYLSLARNLCLWVSDEELRLTIHFWYFSLARNNSAENISCESLHVSKSGNIAHWNKGYEIYTIARARKRKEVLWGLIDT